VVRALNTSGAFTKRRNEGTLVTMDRHRSIYMMMIYLTAIGMTPGGSSAVHIYTKTLVTKNL
jgi:hypothetical protein